MTLTHSTPPSWDNTQEYPSAASSILTADLDHASKLRLKVAELAEHLAPCVPRAETLTEEERRTAVDQAQKATLHYEEATILLQNVLTFLSCELSVDARQAAAKTLYGKTQSLQADLERAFNPVELLLKLTDERFVAAYLQHPEIKSRTFQVQKSRELRDQTLPLGEEDLLIGLGVNGPLAWGNLYDSLAGSISCTLDLPEGTRQVGLAEAASLSQDPREAVRETAHRAVGNAWRNHEESASAILNSLAGWRLEEYKRRSYKSPVHFLAAPLHQNRISRATLDAMMTAVREHVDLGRRVLRLQARILGKSKLAPWDLFAPCPASAKGSWQPPSFADAIKLIADAYSEIHPDMGDFVRMMDANRWIEATVGPNKRPGAYCTQFVKSRTPRVYMTYSGGMRELKTLAHELGHAFHSWVMRDMPLPATHYPMTLAETASIFGETVVNNVLLKQAQTDADRLQFTWAQAREVESFILNIPARYQFEKTFYQRRQEGTLPPSDLRHLMTESWQAWYGDALSEMDSMFWASKLHFSISELSFYNFPYTFGYLFSLGVYAQRERLAERFYPAYVALLRDTGTMTAEDVAVKHLGADLTQPDFWRQSLAIAADSVAQFEAAASRS